MLPFDGKNVPHLIIEVNQKCNITCRACYKTKFDYTKSLDKIKAEVDYAVSQRRLHVITLAGGEPSLHPKLPEVISYISQKGIMVQMLSNGFALTDKRLALYKKAGLYKIFLHIDSQQQRPDFKAGASETELNLLRTRISDKIISHGIGCGLEITLYQDNMKDFPDFMQYFLESPNYKWLLVTCCCDATLIKAKFDKKNIPAPETQENSLANQEVTISEVYYSLHKHHAMVPYAYVASNKNPEDMRWLIYFSFSINHRNGNVKVLHTKSSFKRLAILGNKIQQKKFGTYSFDVNWNGFQSFIFCLLYGLLSLSPVVLFKTLIFLANMVSPGAVISHKLICFQQGPNLTPTGDLEYCKACPDITVRNGKLVPVCMVDFLTEIPEALN